MNKIELLAPAGDLRRGIIAFEFGADAIYFGGQQFSLRARSSNFSINEIKQIIDFAHSKNKKAYLVTNILCHNNLLVLFDKFLKRLKNCLPDAFICSDPFVIEHIRKFYPKAEIHISTQQSVTNSKAALFFANNRANRIILAREVSIKNAKQIANKTKNIIDIEMFCHGALCVGYSGRCMLSNYMSLRDSNNGGCAHSCRWTYHLFNNNKLLLKNFYISIKDLSLINYLKSLRNSKIKSLKIEGRMKSENYLANTVNAYRKVIDNPSSKKILADANKQLSSVANRPTCSGWAIDECCTNKRLFHNPSTKVNQSFAFTILKKLSDCEYIISSRNYFSIKNEFIVLSKNYPLRQSFLINKIFSKNNESLKIVNTPKQTFKIVLNKKLNLSPDDIVQIK